MKRLKNRQPPATMCNIAFSDGPVATALEKIAKVFPFGQPRGRPRPDTGLMAARLIVFSLANVEIIAPRFSSMIDYCEAEGLDQKDYLESLIETKFKKKLHLAKNRRASSQ